jgi:hypothetical protein
MMTMTENDDLSWPKSNRENNMIGSLKRSVGTKLAFAAGGAAAALAIGAAAFASIPDSGGVIHGCYQKNSGIVRIVDTANGSCANGEIAIQWNDTGPAGTQGPAGPQGPVGPQGPGGPANVVVRTGAPVEVPPSGPIVRDAYASCLAGERATGGGALNSGPAPGFYSTVLLDSFPTVNGLPAENGATAMGWFARARNNNSDGANQSIVLTAYVLCAAS